MADEKPDEKPDEKSGEQKTGFNELGRSGLKHFSGNIYEEYLPELQGMKGVRIFQEMSENGAVIRASLFAIESLLRSVDWGVEPVSEDEADIEAAEFLESCQDDLNQTWEDFISEVLSELIYGWSFFEIVYKKRDGEKEPSTPPSDSVSSDPQPSSGPARSKHDDGRIGWRKFGFRAQDTLYRWEIDDVGGINGMWQYPVPGTAFSTRPNDVVLMPIEKSLLFRTTSVKNSPEGRSLLRGAYRAWFLAKRLEEIEAIGMERDLNGMPIAKVPMELLSESRTAEQQSTYEYIKDVITKVKRDEQAGIIWPLVYDDEGNEMYVFELLTSGSSNRTFDTNQTIQRYQQQQAMTLLSDWLLLGHESVGSFALSSDKTEIFAVALGSILDGIEEVLNRHAVPRLFELNNFDVEEHPQFRHGDIETPDLAALSGYIQALAGSGAQFFPDMILEDRLREMADLPPIDPELFEQNQVPGEEGGFFPGEQQPMEQGMAPPPAPPATPPAESVAPPQPARSQPQAPPLSVAKRGRPRIREFVKARK